MNSAHTTPPAQSVPFTPTTPLQRASQTQNCGDFGTQNWDELETLQEDLLQSTTNFQASLTVKLRAMPKLTSDLDDESPSDPSDTGVLAGCCFLGWIVGGPCLAFITTFGGNWAKKKEGPFGESTRALGRVADAAGKTANDDHLFDKIKESISSLFGRDNSRSQS